LAVHVAVSHRTVVYTERYLYLYVYKTKCRSMGLITHV